MLRTLICVVGSISIGLGHLGAQDITSVLRSPRSFHDKQVRLEGILRGEKGPIFDLYPTPTAALRMRPTKAIRVKAATDWKYEGPFDLRRVRVIGVIDANDHGDFGNPCAISLESLELLSSSPVAPWSSVAVLFRNERASPVAVVVKWPHNTSSFEVMPTEYQVTLISIDASVRVESESRVPIAKAEIKIEPDSRYFDKTNMALYYRITKNGIETVLPNVAENWGWRR